MRFTPKPPKRGFINIRKSISPPFAFAKLQRSKAGGFRGKKLEEDFLDSL
jgi:hypothetical protein